MVLDALLRPAVHVLDLQGLRRLGAFGRRGDGPGEFKDPEQIVTGASDTPDVVWILDGVHQRLTRLSLSDIERGTVKNVETHKMDGPNAGSLVRAPDGRWFAAGWITGGRVARYGADLQYDRTILGFPAAAGDAPGTTLLQAYESWVVADPAGGRLAAANALGGTAGDLRLQWRADSQSRSPRTLSTCMETGAIAKRKSSNVPLIRRRRATGLSIWLRPARYLYAVFSGHGWNRMDPCGFPERFRSTSGMASM